MYVCMYIYIFYLLIYFNQISMYPSIYLFIFFILCICLFKSHYYLFLSLFNLILFLMYFNLIYVVYLYYVYF